MISESRSDSNASFGFEPCVENNISESKSNDAIHMTLTSNSPLKPAASTSGSTDPLADSSTSIKKPFMKPKPILKHSRRCSTPELTSISS